ncbi:MAG: metal-dependent transcriptional regulator [Candidatus Helarchaeota archaeon]
MSISITMKRKTLEDYLKIIYILSLDQKKIENEDIALLLETEQSEVKKNIDELLKNGYITYNKDKYRFFLTDKGLTIAKKIYQKHEMFEDFFKKIISLGHDAAHIYSDILEHISDDFTEKKFGQILQHYDYWRKVMPLIFLKKGEIGRLVRIKRDFCSVCRLYELGLCGNCEIQVLESSSQKGPMKISVRGSELVIDYNQAKNILVENISGDKQWNKSKENWRRQYQHKWKRGRKGKGKRKKRFLKKY